MTSLSYITGQQAEVIAQRYLLSKGLKNIAKNYRCRRGEIDLIMADGETIVFIEVRMRRSNRFGSAAESIDRRKQQKIIVTALHFLQSRRLDYSPTRFDVLTLSGNENNEQLHWIQNAFST